MTNPFAEVETEGADDPLEQDTETPEAQPDPSGQDGGWWLTETDTAKVRQAVLDLWKRDKASADKRMAKEQRNELLRAGVRGVRVIASTERDEYTVRAPFGAEDAPKAPNKSDQLIRRIASTLTVDPPGPEVTPTSDSDEERAAAELAERILKVEGSPAERDDVSLLRQLIDMAGTYASVFVYTHVAPHGGGLVPLEIQAHPGATSTEDALVITDPATGMQTPADPAMLVSRYVALDGSLTSSAAQAQMVWQPKVVETILRPSQVRFVPHVGVTGVADADGVLIGRVDTLGNIVAQYYDGERPAEEVIKQLVKWRPDDMDWKRWVPQSQRDGLDGEAPTRPDGTIADEALVVTLCLYLRSGPLAPLGAYLCIGGPPAPIVRTPWKAEIGEGEGARTEFLPLPVAQMRWREDTATGCPYGVAAIEDLGPLEEMRATMLKYVLDYTYRFGNPQVYLPIGTTIQPGQMARRDGTPIYVDPQSKPFYEDLPPLAPAVQQVYDGMGAEMDTASGLEQSAQGVASSSVKSGRHAQQIIEQALVALAGVQQNANKCISRIWSLRLTLMRAFYTTPRILDYLGEGGDYQQRTWLGTDLMGAGDVAIARGTGTMMTKGNKAEMAEKELGLAVQMGDQTAAMRYFRTITGGTAPLLGLQDDPIRQRIARQLAQWKEGAKAQHEPPPPPPAPEVVGVDPMGQPIMAPPPPDPVLVEAQQAFAPNPTDELPHVAPVRFSELADTMASRAFLQADPRYQQALQMEYERMRQAAGVMTRAEQMQQQAQQAAQQQAMQIEQIQSKNAQQAASTAYAEKEGGPAAQRMAMQNAASEMSANPQPPM
jgi:hypothetical protein